MSLAYQTRIHENPALRREWYFGSEAPGWLNLRTANDLWLDAGALGLLGEN